MLDPEFGSWLAGFIAGEGSFVLVRDKRGCWNCTLSLALRDDDMNILHEICNRAGFGHVYPQKPYRTTKAQARWQVASLRDQLALIEVLDRYPLRTRKAADYQVWRKAVLAKQAKELHRLGALAQELKDARTYGEPTYNE